MGETDSRFLSGVYGRGKCADGFQIRGFQTRLDQADAEFLLDGDHERDEFQRIHAKRFDYGVGADGIGFERKKRLDFDTQLLLYVFDGHSFIYGAALSK
jgi:hypothetical protein